MSKRYKWVDRERDAIIVQDEETGDSYTVSVASPEYSQINIEQVEPPDDDEDEEDSA